MWGFSFGECQDASLLDSNSGVVTFVLVGLVVVTLQILVIEIAFMKVIVEIALKYFMFPVYIG
jgi:hypothetical protein